RRPCDSLAFATSSYGTNFAHPLSAATFVNAAVSVVFPWSMCPIVPTFTCGFDRSNFSFAIALRSVCHGAEAPSPQNLPSIPVRAEPVEPRAEVGPPSTSSGRTVSLRLPLHSRHDFLADVLWRLLVLVEVHAVRCAALRARPEVRRVAEHLGQRHARV